MMLRSQHNTKNQKISISKLMSQHYSPPPSKCPPPHIFSEDSQSQQPSQNYSKVTNRKRKKIFDLKKKKQQSIFNQTTNLYKKPSSSGQMIPQFSSSTFVKDKTLPQQHLKNQPEAYEQNFILSNKNSSRHENPSPYFPTMKNLNVIPPANNTNIAQKHKIFQKQEKFKQIKDKVQQHDSEIRQLNEKFERKCQKDIEVQKKFIDEIKKGEKSMLRKQSDLHQYLKKIQKLQSQNELKKQQLYRYELQLQRAKRVEELAKENERLYQDLLKNQTKTQDATQFNYFRDQNLNSISALPTKNEEEDSYDNGTIGELLSPFAINPNEL